MRGLSLVVSLLLAAEPTPDDLAQFKNLGPQMSVSRLRLENAPIDAVTKRFGAVPPKDWLQVDGNPYPYLCYVGANGALLGVEFARDGDRFVLGRFEIVASGVPLVYRPSWINDEKNAPRCKHIVKAPTGTDGGLRLGMTKAQALAVLGEQNRNVEFLGHEGFEVDENRLEYGGWVRAVLDPKQRATASKNGLDPDDFYTVRELRLEFSQGKLVAIRALQMTAT